MIGAARTRADFEVVSGDRGEQIGAQWLET
jgi:hypothetical protein